MASTFPTSLDTFTNPTATSLLTSPSHSLSHSDLNDAVEALEAKVAIGNTVLGTYIAYTPSFASGVTVGDGVATGAYCLVNGFVHVYGFFTLGSTSAITGGVNPNLPVTVNSGQAANGMIYGTAQFRDVSTAAQYPGVVTFAGNQTACALRLQFLNPIYLAQTAVSSSTPFTWAVGDVITWNLYYRAA
jgi:hypothetical protein